MKELEKVLKLHENQADFFKSIVEASPAGKLYLQKNPNGSHQMLYYNYDSGSIIRRGVNNDKDIQRALARKEFASRSLEILEKNIEAIRKVLDNLIPFDPDQILKSMAKAYSLLPEEYFFNRDELVIAAGLDDDLLSIMKRHEEWWKKPYNEYWGYPENKVKTTSRGQKVRSISELLIAETLYKYSIPFHYEEVLEVGGKKYAPDFTFEARSKEMLYMDYFGMMEDERYARRNFRKLDDYYDIGLIPGDNLIVAFDSKGIMDVGIIEGIILNEVIPRL